MWEEQELLCFFAKILILIVNGCQLLIWLTSFKMGSGRASIFVDGALQKWRCQKVGAPKRIWQCLKLERHSPCPTALTRCLKIKRPLPFAASRTKRFWPCLKLERHLPSANVLRQHSPLDALPCEPGSVAAKGLPSVPDLIHEDAGRGSAKERQGGILLVS